jgi:hypothetical protein
MMLTRYRWYRIQIPLNQGLAKIISDNPLTQDASFGFSHISGEFGTSKYRFLWRTKVLVTRFDDEGNPFYEEVASVSFTDFAIVSVDETTFLRIENPGRNIRELMNALESILGLGFTSKPLTFEKAKPTTVFESVDSTKLVGLKVVGAVIDDDLVARMEFASKRGMIVANMKLLNDLRYKVETSIFELIYEGVRGQLVFTSNGLVKISGQLAPRLVHLIEQDLPKLG